MHTFLNLPITALALAPLVVATSASASSADNDCITFGTFHDPIGLGYGNIQWWSDNGGGSTHVQPSDTSYTWCAAQPQTTYHWSVQTCIDFWFATDCSSATQFDDVSTKWNLMRAGDFENQTSNQLDSSWGQEGSGARGVDVGAGHAHNGQNNAWINTADGGWNAITFQWPLGPNQTFHYTGWVRTSDSVNSGYFGIRDGAGRILSEVQFGPVVNDYQRLAVDISTPGAWDEYTMYVGFWAPGWIQIDDLWLTNAQ